jgi:hypothetical protein
VRLKNEVSPEFRDSASLDGGRPTVELRGTHLPERSALVEVLQHDILLALLRSFASVTLGPKEFN